MSARDLIESAVQHADTALLAPGDWLTGTQRRAAWVEARDARSNELDMARRDAISPAAVDGAHNASDDLPAAAVEVVHRVASDPGRLTRAWADEMMASLHGDPHFGGEAAGDAVYTELVGVAAIAAVVDTFACATTSAEQQMGSPTSGDPACVRPDSVGDIGAWVHQTTADPGANVSRSLSLVPETNGPWRGLVDGLYSRGAGFVDLAWDRALSRPQVELVAARTTAELECFY